MFGAGHVGLLLIKPPIQKDASMLRSALWACRGCLLDRFAEVLVDMAFPPHASCNDFVGYDICPTHWSSMLVLFQVNSDCACLSRTCSVRVCVCVHTCA